MEINLSGNGPRQIGQFYGGLAANTRRKLVLNGSTKYNTIYVDWQDALLGTLILEEAPVDYAGATWSVLGTFSYPGTSTISVIRFTGAVGVLSLRNSGTVGPQGTVTAYYFGN